MIGKGVRRYNGNNIGNNQPNEGWSGMEAWRGTMVNGNGTGPWSPMVGNSKKQRHEAPWSWSWSAILKRHSFRCFEV
jgi:hypothetical protein